MSTTRAIPAEAVEWLITGERGVSSNTILAHLTGRTMQGHPSHPHDPSDFRRCHLLLEAVPEFKARLPEMASVSPQWSALVGAWDELVSTMDEECPTWRNGVGRARKTYDRMKELTHA